MNEDSVIQLNAPKSNLIFLIPHSMQWQHTRIQVISNSSTPSPSSKQNLTSGGEYLTTCVTHDSWEEGLWFPIRASPGQSQLIASAVFTCLEHATHSLNPSHSLSLFFCLPLSLSLAPSRSSTELRFVPALRVWTQHKHTALQNRKTRAVILEKIATGHLEVITVCAGPCSACMKVVNNRVICVGDWTN